MKYFLPGYMIAAALGASLVSASALEARGGPKFYHGDLQKPAWGDIKIASKNAAGGKLGAVLASILRPANGKEADSEASRKRSAWFAKNVIKKVDGTSAQITVRGPDLQKVVTETVQFSEVKEHLYGADDVLWPDSIALALAKANWPHSGGPLEEMDVGQALTALTGLKAITVYQRFRMGDPSTKDINEFGASPPTETIEEFKKALGPFTASDTSLVLVTAESATKCKKNHAYSLYFSDSNPVLLDPSAEKDAEDASKRTVEEIFEDVAQIWALEDAKQLQ